MRSNAVANRERILVAAEEVFGEHGAAGSTEDVARRAEVGIATVFRHFPTKDELIEAALLRHFEVLVDQARGLAGGANPGRAFERLVRTMIETGSTKLTLAGQMPGGTFPPSVADASGRLRAVVGELLAEAKGVGAVRRGVTVDEVYLLVRGLAQVSAVAPPPKRTLDRAIGIVLAGLRP